MKNVLFRNKETGEIVTSFNLLDIAKYEEVKENNAFIKDHIIVGTVKK